MRSLSLFILLNLFLFLPQLSSHELSQEFSQLMKKYQIPGVAYAEIRNRKLHALHCYGFSDVHKGLPVTESSIFQVGSISKMLTAWGIMLLIEQGKLDLDAPIENYLHRWHLPPSGYDHQQVTLKRILNHSAGLSVPSYYGYPSLDQRPDLITSLNGIKGSHPRLQLKSPPGGGFHYSGGGYTLLQLAVEDVTGTSFDDFMKQQLLLPLGMVNSAFSIPQNHSSRLCQSYGLFGQELSPRYFTEAAAAGLYSTISDLAQFALSFLSLYASQTSAILSPSSLQKMIEAGGTSYALGCDIEFFAGSSASRLVYHTGANPGWRAGIYLLPELGDGIVILTNSDCGLALIEEIAGEWVLSRVGSPPQFYKTLLNKRLFLLTATLLLGLMWMLYLVIPSLTARLRRGYWILIALLGLFWWGLFYTPWIFFYPSGGGKWLLVSLMPPEFNALTFIISLCSLSSLLTLLISKPRTRIVLP